MSKIKISLKVNDTEYLGSADTIEDAIALIKPDQRLRTKGILTIKDGKKVAEKAMNILQMNRLFVSKNKEISVKNFKSILKFK